MYQIGALEQTLYFWFGANDTSGSGGDGASAAADVRLAGAAASAAPVLSPTPTLLSHVNYSAGCYEVAVPATAVNGFAAGGTYGVFCTLLIDSQNPTGFVGSFKLVASGSPLESTTEAAEAVDTELTSNHGSGAWTIPSGTGANTVTLTFTDTNGDAVGSTIVTIEGTGITAVTSASGVAVFYLDDDTYTVITPDTPNYVGEENSLTVSGDTAASYEVTARSVPVPSSADTCMVYVWVIDEAGNAATEGTFEVVDIISPTATSTTPKQRVIQSDNPDYLDDNGYAELELLQGAVVRTKLSPENDVPVEKEITVPATATADWNDL